MENKKVEFIVKDIEHYFGFLDKRGFKLIQAESSPQYNGNWIAKLESSQCAIYITSDRNHILLEFSPANNTDVRKRISIEKLIYNLSEGRDIIAPFNGNLAWGKRKQLERLSSLLNHYVDQITGYFSITVERHLKN